MGACPVMAGALCRPLEERASRQWYNNPRSTPARRPMSGTLFVVATPIGNLEDITLRALRVLREADVIAAEDTRRTAKLLAHYAISTPTLSFHEHNTRDADTSAAGAPASRASDVALVTDAGTPGISDPGVELVQACCRRGHSGRSRFPERAPR